MRLLFVADGRSPTAINWLQYFVEAGHDVYVASTAACDIHLPVREVRHIPVATALGAGRRSGKTRSTGGLRRRLSIRHWLGPLTIPVAARRLRRFMDVVEPDVVHALRIPFEGMLTASAGPRAPLILSTWGNDFTLHAVASPLMRRYTKRALRRAAALHTDCLRDLRLALTWGFDSQKPTLVIPGNGGVRREVFKRPDVPAGAPVVVNPRGPRVYVNNEAFFHAIPIVLQHRPGARFLCASMAGEADVHRLVQRLGISSAVDLLEPAVHAQMAGVFQRSQVLVSPSLHDGTPNSLLEGMACGTFPVAGDLESIREWITHGRNGLLVDSSSPPSIADAILVGLDREDLRHEAAGLNEHIIAERADYAVCMPRAASLYRTVAATG